MKQAIHYIGDVITISRGQHFGSVGGTLSACRAHLRYVERRCTQQNLQIDGWLRRIESEIEKSAKAIAMRKAVFAMPNDMSPKQGSEFLLDFLSSQEIFVEKSKRTENGKAFYEKKYVALPRENFGVGTHVDKTDNHHNHAFWINRSSSGKSVDIDKESLRLLHANWRDHLQKHGYELKDAVIKEGHRGYLYGGKGPKREKKTINNTEFQFTSSLIEEQKAMQNAEKMESAVADSENLSFSMDLPEFSFSVPEIEKEKEEEQEKQENNEIIIEFAMPEIRENAEFTEEQLDKIRAEITDICDETAKDSDLIELDDVDFENLSDDELSKKLEEYYRKGGYKIESKKDSYLINRIKQLENLESDEIPESQMPNVTLDVSRLGRPYRKERQLQRVRNKLNAHRANRAKRRRKSSKKQKGRIKMNESLIGSLMQKAVKDLSKQAEEMKSRKNATVTVTAETPQHTAKAETIYNAIRRKQ